MLTDKQLQSLRNLGNEAEAAADEISILRARVMELATLVPRVEKAERERWTLTHDQIAALTIMLDHYRGDPRTECLRPLVYGPNAQGKPQP